MARKEKVARINKASKKSAAVSVIGKDQYYAISGTSYIGQTKEELKPQRRQLNADAGVVEAEVSSNAWPYRITKSAAHPHNAA